MAWIESHQDLGTHRKTMRLCTLLKIDDLRAVGLLHFLWWWALDNVPDGNLTGLTDKELALACHWKGKPEALINSLCQAGWIDRGNGTVKLHNWQDYAGKLVTKRLANQRYQREHRERERLLSDDCQQDVRLTSDLCQGATVPNRTQQNSTEDDRRVEDISSSADKNNGLSDVFTLYENSIETISDGLKETITTAVLKYTGVWVVDAILVAKDKGAEKRNWEYISGILRTWEREGHITGYAPSGKGPPRSDDPDKFIKGKYGEFVQR